MVTLEHAIVQAVYAAKTDTAAADAFVQQYLPFVRAETVRFTRQAIEQGHEDELSIALLAFYEAILSYEKGRGAFLPYASRAIRNRLIDHFRAERRHRGQVSMQASAGEDGRTLADTLPARDELDASELRLASRQEIAAFGAQLAEFGITFSDVADNCPKQDRTLAACRRVLDHARSAPELLDRLVQTRRLPVGELVLGSGVDKKTIERHRKYLVAILLAFTNGYEIIRGHLCQIAPQGGRRTA